ncbi:MAG: GAF domain-containing protein, partial [Phormidesmis sp.]
MTATNVSHNSASTVDSLEQSAPQPLDPAEGTYGNDASGALLLSADDISTEPGSQQPVQQPEGEFPDLAIAQTSPAFRSSTALPKRLGQRAFGIANRMAQAATLENLYQITATELRKRFQGDRAFIYRFHAQSEGHVIAESVTAGYTPALGETLNVIAFGAGHAHDYQTQAVVSLTDASEEAVSPYQMQLLQRFQVQASLSLPVFAEGQMWGLLVVQQCRQPRQWQESEIGLLYQVSTELALSLQACELEQQIQKEIARGETLAGIIRNIREFSDLQHIFESTTKSLRSFLKSDRVAIFQFHPGSNHSSGEVVVESVSPHYVAAKEITIEDHCFSTQTAESYRLGRISTIDDIYNRDLPECHINILAQFQVRANLVVPLLKDNQLWGLFCIHQCSGPRQWQPVEVAFVQRVAGQLDLAMQQADYLAQVQEKTQQLEASVAREQLIAKITERLRTTNDLSSTLKSAVQDIRQIMEADRVGLFQFDAEKNYSVGEFVVEDVTVGVRSAMATKVQDHCFAEGQAENYRKGRQWVVNDVQALDLPDCLAELLSQMQVKASIVVPLLERDRLWGLFAIHQCQRPREWQEVDVQFAQRIGTQLNLALQQADYLAQVKEKTAKLTETADREKASKEQLQQQVIQLLKAVGPALQGDLTVRAPVTDTEVGTVASAYNNTLQSLQKIVLQVQAAANQVGETSKLSETS